MNLINKNQDNDISLQTRDNLRKQNMNFETINREEVNLELGDINNN